MKTALMDTNFPMSFASCRALVFQCDLETERWQPVGEVNEYSTIHLLLQQSTQHGRVYKIFGRLESSGSVTVDITLHQGIVYNVVQPTWHEIHVSRHIVFGLMLGKDSDGGKFSVVVQNTLTACPRENPATSPQFPIPKEAWGRPASTQFQHYPTTDLYRPLSPSVVPKSSVASLPVYTASYPSPPPVAMASPRSPSPRTPNISSHYQTSTSDSSVDNCCAALESAIEMGDTAQAINMVRTLASKKLALTVKPKDQKQSTVEVIKEKTVRLRVVVEDSETSGGAFNLQIPLNTTIEKLQNEVADKYGFPPKVQRWIIGKKMAKPNESLLQCKVRETGFTAYLYLLSGRNVELTREDVETLKLQKQKTQPSATNRVQVGVANMAHLPEVTRQNVLEEPSAMHRAASMPSLREDISRPLPQGADMFGSQINLENPQRTGSSLSSSLGVEPQVAQPQNAGNVDGVCGAVPSGIQVEEIGAVGPQIDRDVTAVSEEPKGWVCPQCTLINIPTRPGCAMCGEERPEDYIIPQNILPQGEEWIRLEQERIQSQLFHEAEEEQRINAERLLRLLHVGLQPETE
ncbi:predicted protein [Nematostella vectensis]|uniref:RanBP-type and C3HC4-type zinc finger-containing protein 1 n=1 Tax=Nematostella vectensis TaxID=45351 RepID=A7SAP1_NEMVE|nr:predicted protein [Nematostella vectensis]|eukprot:XP_001631290.1 predicted protein [Nematostella vectensis]